MKYLVLLLACASLCANWRVREVEGELFARRDHFGWTINTEGIDILSELIWKNLNIVGARGSAQFGYCGPYLFKLDVAGGWLFNGQDRDSDYSESGRVGEWSRSYSKVNGYVASASGSAGYVLSMDPRCCKLVIPSLGVAWRQIHLRSRDGVMVIPEDSEMGQGLNSIYEADFLTGYLEIEGRNRLGPCLFLRSILQIHGGQYLGRGNWLMRDLKFSHEAPAFGFVTGMQALFRSSPYLRLTGGFRFEYWNTAHGSGNFNRAEWKSVEISVGLVSKF